MNTLEHLKINKTKKDFIQNIPQIFNDYSDTHEAFFITMAFQNSFGNQKQRQSAQYEKIFTNLYIELGKALLKKPRNEFFNPIMLLMPEESLKIDKNAAVLNRNRLQKDNGRANTHYHGVLFIHKIHTNQFCEAFVRNIKDDDGERFELNYTAFGHYAADIYSTDIRHCLTIEDVKTTFSYSSKKFLCPNAENENFDMDDVFIYTAGLNDIQQIINSYMHFNDPKPFSNYMKSKQFTQKNMCEFLVTLKDIHPFFKAHSIIFQADKFLKNPNGSYPVSEIGLLKLQSDILKFIEGGAVKNQATPCNIAMTYVSESQVLQASRQFINTLILLGQTIKKPVSTKGDVYVPQENSKEASLYTI